MSSASQLSSEDLVRQVRTLRDRIRALHAERAELSAASIDMRAALARVDSFVTSLAAQGRPSIGVFVGRESSPAPTDIIAPGFVGPDGARFDQVLACLAWLFPDTMRAQLGAEVEADYSARNGVDEETRAQRLAQIDVELFELEVAEERSIMQLEAAGVRSVQRRPDADPRAIVAA